MPVEPHPQVAADVVALTWAEDADHPLGAALQAAVRHSTTIDPAGGWALPGAYVQADETVEATVTRVLADKVGLPRTGTHAPIHLPPFSAVDRDPRRRTISLPVVVLLPNRDRPAIRGASWATLPADGDGAAVGAAIGDGAAVGDARGEGVGVEGVATRLLLDHEAIIAAALAELRRRLAADDLAFLRGLLAPAFALRELERVWNALAGTRHNPASFRRRMTGLARPDGAGPWLVETGRYGARASGRPAKLYRFT